jgi:hypothetical protein
MHNTVAGGSAIDCASKSGLPASTTRVVDNIAPGLNLNDYPVHCTPAQNTHNLWASGGTSPNFSGTPSYTGGPSPSTYAGFKLAVGSPGRGAADDSLDIGARIP